MTAAIRLLVGESLKEELQLTSRAVKELAAEHGWSTMFALEHLDEAQIVTRMRALKRAESAPRLRLVWSRP